MLQMEVRVAGWTYFGPIYCLLRTSLFMVTGFFFLEFLKEGVFDSSTWKDFRTEVELRDHAPKWEIFILVIYFFSIFRSIMILAGF